jgi:teichuronic acid exporter
MVLVLVLVTFNFGIYGLVWSSVIGSFAALFINTFYTGGLILYYAKDQLKDLIPTLIISIFMAIIMYIIHLLLISYINLIQIAVPSILGIFFFGLLSYMTKNESFFNLISLIKTKSINDTSN